MLRPSESELRPKGWKSPDLQSDGTRIIVMSPLKRFEQVRSYSPRRLVGQSAILKENSVQCCRRVKNKGYRPLDYHSVIFRRRRRFTIFESDETDFASHLALISFRLDYRRKPGERFLQKHSLGTVFHLIWIKVQSMTWGTFHMFFEACDICNPVSVVKSDLMIPKHCGMHTHYDGSLGNVSDSIFDILTTL